jgi:rhodanese-related sulfurtransferase
VDGLSVTTYFIFMNKKMLLLIVTLVLFTVWGCQGQVKSGAYRTMLKSLLSHSVPEITVEKAKSTKQAVWLDAREPHEYTVSHLQNATYVGYDQFTLNNVPAIAKDTPIIVYCSVGYRSEKVAEKLIAAGFTHVQNLYGGIFEWVNEGQPVYDTGGATQKVHAYNRSWGIWLKKGKKVY